MLQIARFLEFTFLGRLETYPARVAKVAVFSRRKQAAGADPESSHDAVLIKNKTVLFVNWIFAIVLVMCLLTMVVYAIKYKSESVPIYISSPFFMVLGWFGHAYTTFLEISKPRQR